MAHIVLLESNYAGLMALKSAAKVGHQISFVTSLKNRSYYWGPDAPDLLRLATRVVEVSDTFDSQCVADAVESIHNQNPVDAVVTVFEYFLYAAAVAGKRIGCRSHQPEMVAHYRDKNWVRSVLDKAGVPSARHALARDYKELMTACKHVGFPAVIKPVHGVASYFVRVARSEIELIAMFDSYQNELKSLSEGVRGTVQGGLLVEEYLAGRMLSVEAGVSAGDFQVFAIGERKRSSKNEVIELGTVMPAPLSSRENDEVREYAASVSRALGLSVGMMHLEVMLTSAGPRLIEANCRLMGGGLPKLYNLTYKADIYESVFASHLGQPLIAPSQISGRVGVSRIFGSSSECTLKHSFDLTFLDQYKANELEFNLSPLPGAKVPRLNSNHDYLGHLRLVASTAEEGNSLADQIIQRLSDAIGTELLT